MYDLTSILTTIAACSASFVAILGGFIASRLISLNAERDEIQTRLSEINEEIVFYEKERNTSQSAIDEDDALDFIIDNIVGIIEEESLDTVYKEENHPRIEKAVLIPYWEKAMNVLSLLYDDLKDRNDDDVYKENEDNIPISVAKMLQDDFEYDICKEIVEHLDSQSSGFPNYLGAITAAKMPRISNGLWYAKAQDRVTTYQSKVDWLNLQKNQLSIRKKALSCPKGMRLGLLLFAAFSILNIVCPLIMTPFVTDDFVVYSRLKIIVITIFGVGLALTLLYLIYLLHWKKSASSNS